MDVFTETDFPTRRGPASSTTATRRKRSTYRHERERLDEPTGATRTALWATVLTLVLGDAAAAVAVTACLQAAASTFEAGSISGWPALAGVTAAMVGALALAGAYRLRFVHPAAEMKRRAGQIAGIGVAVTGTGFVLADTAAALATAAATGAAIVLFPACRAVTRILCARLSWWGVPAAVVSFDTNGRQVVDTLNRWPEIGLRPVACLQDSGSDERSMPGGKPEQAAALAKRWTLPYALVSLPHRSHPRRAKLLAHFSGFFDHVFTVTPADLPALWTTGEEGNGLRGAHVSNLGSRPRMQLVKRLLDVVGASLVLLLLFPLFAAIAGLIKVGSEGPVFYRQERVGMDGRIFTIFKFRSMYCDADERLADVLDADPERRREYERYHKLEDDPRVTPIGRILRDYSLDELPQLLNVVLGNMSLVGPRAYLPAELEDMRGLEKVILQTPPGVTGLWQVSGRNNLPFDRRVNLDVHYVQNWSVWLDLYLIARTLPTVLTGEGAN